MLRFPLSMRFFLINTTFITQQPRMRFTSSRSSRLSLPIPWLRSILSAVIRLLCHRHRSPRKSVFESNSKTSNSLVTTLPEEPHVINNTTGHGYVLVMATSLSWLRPCHGYVPRHGYVLVIATSLDMATSRHGHVSQRSPGYISQGLGQLR